MTVSTVVGQALRQIRKPLRILYTIIFSCTRAFSTAFIRVVFKQFMASVAPLRQMSGSPPPVHTAATMFQKLCYDNKDALSAGIIVAGWDKEVGPSVYNIPLGGGLFRQPWAIGGSGSTYVYGYCDATYQEGWDRDQTVEFVKNSAFTYMRLMVVRSYFHSPRAGHVSRWIVWWCHPYVRHHREQCRAAVRSWGPAAQVLAGQGGTRHRCTAECGACGRCGDGGRRIEWVCVLYDWTLPEASGTVFIGIMRDTGPECGMVYLGGAANTTVCDAWAWPS